MKTVRGATLVITGAASGMGLLYAKRAVAEGASAVVLWDRDASALQRAAEQLALISGGASSVQSLTGSTTTIRTNTVDLLVPEQIEQAASDTLDTIGVPDILINNAGIIAGNEYFWLTNMTSQNQPIMQVNTLAHMHVTRLFLPHMIDDAGRQKRILNVASAAATVSNPRMSVYAASKWAMYGWSDSLRLELMQAGHTHVSVTTFCPSYVNTGMFAGARGMWFTPVITPESAVRAAWSAMLAAKPVQLTPPAVNLAKVLRGVLPVRAWDRLANLMGVYRSMQKFTGRS